MYNNENYSCKKNKTMCPKDFLFIFIGSNK